MIALLIEEDWRIKEQVGKAFNPDKTMIAKRKGKKGDREAKLNYCKRLGHKEERCFKEMAKEQEQTHANLIEEAEEDCGDAEEEEQACAITATAEI